MNEEPSLEEFQSLIQRVVAADTNDFFELAKILDRNPKTDLAGADISEVNLRGGDLEEANLRGTDLSKTDLSDANLKRADLSRANLSRANLSNANLSNANLSGANLNGANLSGAKVENALFSNTLGINQDVNHYLKRRRAIFQNFQAEPKDYIKFYKSLIIRFLKFTFLGQKEGLGLLDSIFKEHIADIAEISDASEGQRSVEFAEISDASDRHSIVNKVIVPINWFLLIIGTVCFAIIIYKALVLQSEIASEIVFHTFSLVIGWFGGALITYFRMEQNSK